MLATRRNILAAALLAGAAVALASPSLAGGPSPLVEPLASLAEGRLADAESQAMDAIASGGPSAGRAWMIVAAARQRRGRHESAIHAYQMFLASSTNPAMRRHAVEQIRLCRRQLAGGEAPAPPSQRLDATQRAALADRDEQFHLAGSDNFLVHARNPAVARLVADEAQSALARITHALLDGQEYPHVVEVYVWGDQAEFSARAEPAPHYASASYSLTRIDGLLRRRIDLRQTTPDGRLDLEMLDRALPHELCHLVIGEYFGDARPPLAVDEGLAMLAEWQAPPARTMLAAAAAAGRHIPLQRLVTMDPAGADEAALFYAQAFSLMEFLHSHMTTRQMREFLDQLKAECCVAEALQRAMNVPLREDFLDVLSASWRQHAVAQGQFLRAAQETDGR